MTEYIDYEAPVSPHRSTQVGYQSCVSRPSIAELSKNWYVTNGCQKQAKSQLIIPSSIHCEIWTCRLCPLQLDVDTPTANTISSTTLTRIQNAMITTNQKMSTESCIIGALDCRVQTRSYITFATNAAFSENRCTFS